MSRGRNSSAPVEPYALGAALNRFRVRSSGERELSSASSSPAGTAQFSPALLALGPRQKDQSPGGTK
jgi:hypothetical protein